jgi:hypothetical protein
VIVVVDRHAEIARYVSNHTPRRGEIITIRDHRYVVTQVNHEPPQSGSYSIATVTVISEYEIFSLDGPTREG